MLFRTRAAALALLVNLCVIIGLLFGAVAFAGAAKPADPRAQAYAAAVRTGYDHGVPPAPVVALQAAPTVRASPAPEPVASLGPRRISATPHAVECLAQAVYYEARGERPAGRAAVAQVVLNRTRHAGFPKSVCGVVYQGRGRGDCQFSFVCNGAMREPRDPNAWTDARRIAIRALAGHVMSQIGRAISFHAAVGRTPSGAVRLGGHVFFT